MVRPISYQQSDKGRRVDIIGGVYEGLFGWIHLTANTFPDKQWVIIEAGRNVKGKLHEVEKTHLLKKSNFAFVNNTTPSTFEQALLKEHADVHREMRSLAKKLASFVDYHPRDGKKLMGEFYKMWCEEKDALDRVRNIPNARRVTSHPAPARVASPPQQPRAQPSQQQPRVEPGSHVEPGSRGEPATPSQLRNRFSRNSPEVHQQIVVYSQNQEIPHEGDGWGFQDTISLVSDSMSTGEVQNSNEIRNTVFSDFLPSYDDLMNTVVSDDESTGHQQNNELRTSARRRVH